jgi:RHS repeat-associated protein
MGVGADGATASRPANGARNDSAFFVAPPSLNLPKGGGAVRGIGEKFAANPVTGTGSMTVPIFSSPGRSGFGPQLSLTYDSGAGNGPFGLGWNLSLPAITRKTDKGLPRYDDKAQSDVFLLSGAEDLVPVSDDDGGSILPRVVDGITYDIRRYRPRIEGLFARIERWTHRPAATDIGAPEIFWRSISQDNVTTWYGKSAESRIFDPADPTRIFSWLICESHDDKGNVVCYRYKGEDSAGIDLSAANERNRRDRSTNRYLKRIRYGNRDPYFPVLSETAAWPSPPGADAVDGSNDWFFELVFDYGEHDASNPLSTEVFSPGAPTWTARNDPFSSYRATFEIRTYRRCERVLMFHHFPDEDIKANCLVRSTDFKYAYEAAPNSEADPKNATNPIFSYLLSIQQSGYRRATGGYSRRSTPPLKFEYSQPTIDTEIHEVDAESLENLPFGVDGTSYQWLDLDGEGLPGVLTAQGDGWFYKRNVSPVSLAPADYEAGIEARFAPSELVATQPIAGPGGAGLQFLDLAGDGQLDLVTLRGPAPGFYKRTEDSDWNSLETFRSLPVLDWADPNLRFIDLTGDGHADILISEDSAFCWHASLGEAGFGPAHRVSKLFDEDAGPAIVFADSTESIFLADLSGDGLADIVRVRNGEVCYWPNLGYGNFGAKVTMDNAPWFEPPDLFDGRRLHLADIDGSGLADIIYRGRDGVQLYFNQSGNSWSAANTLSEFPVLDRLSSVAALDLLGNGTACLVWSSPLPGDAGRAMRYIDLMGGQKPHLLIKTTNNLGAETKIDYKPSTYFFLADKLTGTPWLTRLPFVVHCVQRVSVYDKWRNAMFSSTYSYHHGYFDGIEREFRGFGRVEQIDVEDYGASVEANKSSPYVSNQELFQPPVKTITWFHTGLFVDEQQVLSHFVQEYFPDWFKAANPGALDPQDDFKEHALPEPDLVQTDLSAEERREALRACKGMVLRQEVYELDVQALAEGVERPVKLFSTAYHNCHIDRLQRRGANRHAIFLVTESEAITYHYELDLRTAKIAPDPRVAHTLNLKVDKFGRAVQSIAIGYPRRGRYRDSSLPARAEDLIASVQQEAHLSYTEIVYTRPDTVEDDDNYRLSQPWEVKTFELTGLDATHYLSIGDLRCLRLSDEYPPPVAADKIIEVAAIPYQQVADGAKQLRLVEHARTLYYDDHVTGAVAPRTLGRLGLPYEHYKLALTDDLLDNVLKQQLDPNTTKGALARGKLKDAAASGYLSGSDLDDRFKSLKTAGQYWIPSGIVGFGTDPRAHFYLPQSYTDPFGNRTTIAYKYDLLVQSSTDARQNKVSIVAFDFRVLAPRQLCDVSGNLTEVKFDILAMPAATALLGKGDGSEGDSLSGMTDDLLDLSLAERQAFFTQAYDRTIAPTWLDGATSRYVYWFGETADSKGEITWAQHPPAACGIVREQHAAQTTARGARASAVQVAIEYTDGFGAVFVKKMQAEPDPPSSAPMLRWIATGKTILNNKGKPVKQYEPYFSNTEHCFDAAEARVETGVTPVRYYDAPGRLVRTEMPDGTFSRVDFSPWHVTTHDANDTVLESQWFKNRGLPAPGSAEPADPDTRAGWLAALHSGTPAQTHLDSLGREVVAVAHNRVEVASSTIQLAGRYWKDEKYLTFTKLDPESKPLWIRDARGNLVMQYIMPTKPTRAADEQDQTKIETMPVASVPCYDIAGNLLFQHSMDAGDRWMLADAIGKPMLAWDRNERQTDATAPVTEDRLYVTDYDALRRPTHQWLYGNDSPRAMVERFEYQDAQANDRDNLNAQLIRHYDASGLAETVRRDFKGNLEIVQKTLVADKASSFTDWQDLANTNGSAKLNGDTFTRITEYDALNRMTRLYNWHRGDGGRVAVYEPHYSERGLLDGERLTGGATKTAIGVKLDSGTPRQAIVSIRYNAKGQKELLTLGNDTVTTYTYDPDTFRLTNIKTTRTIPAGDACSNAFNDAAAIQDLRYTYDPVGNIMAIIDAAQATAFGSNQRIDPTNRYEYDALYRLISAMGRESRNASGAPAQRDGQFPSFDCPAPDPTRLRNYTQAYSYDPVGNISRVRHVAESAGWTRDYAYAFDDSHQPPSNRLWQTWLSGDRSRADTYGHDTHGNMLNLVSTDPRFNLRWDHRDMIASIDLGGGGVAYYQYDASKRRTRKYIVNQNGLGGSWERIDLGGYELYRRYNGGGAVVEEIDSLHLVESDQRIALVDDVITTSDRTRARPGELTVKGPTLFRYQYGNHLGSGCLELNDGAQIISYEEFHPYGTSAYRAIKSGVEAPPKRYRYTGMERDEESGLNYHVRRYYSPRLGRWNQCDPASWQTPKNCYDFCVNNPIRFFDPNGRWEVDMHFGAVYIAGRLSGASHARALAVALASQSLDDSEYGDAASLKITGVARGTPSSRAVLYTEANNAHALGLSRTEAETVAVKAIVPGRQSTLTVLFGLGLHPAGDFLPHANVSGEPTTGHQQGFNEDFSPSLAPAVSKAVTDDPDLHAADKTFKNPTKALASFERFRELWRRFEGQEGPIAPLDNRTARLLSDFIYAETPAAKDAALRELAMQVGASTTEGDEVLALQDDKKKRQVAYSRLLAAGQEFTKKQSDTAWQDWRSYRTNDQSKLERRGKEDIAEYLVNLPSTIPVPATFTTRQQRNLLELKRRQITPQ